MFWGFFFKQNHISLHFWLLFFDVCVHTGCIISLLCCRLNRGRMTWHSGTTRRWSSPWRSWAGRRDSLLWSGASWLGMYSTGEPKLCQSESTSQPHGAWCERSSYLSLPAFRSRVAAETNILMSYNFNPFRIPTFQGNFVIVKWQIYSW